MIEDMNMRRFTRKTQFDYVRHVARFATYLGRPPDTATVEELRQFQVEQREAGIGIPTMNSIVSALRFFFTHTIDRPDLSRKLYTVKNPRALPVVLSRDEVVLLLGATNCLKHKAALSVAYGAGLRAAEVTMLKVRDVDSKRMLLRVERGKGGRYRNALLPADLLALLREWWTVGRKQGVMHADGWLFPGMHYLKPLSTDSSIGSLSMLPRLRVSKSGSAHTLCGTASPRIYWKTASIFGSSRRCSGMRTSRPPLSTPRSQLEPCARSSVRWTS
jgi:site-specific recombinase XerD